MTSSRPGCRASSHARHRTRSIYFKRQVAQDHLAGQTLHSLARRHDPSRNLVPIWVHKSETGTSEDEAAIAERQRTIARFG